MWREGDRQQRNQHRVVDLQPPAAPDEELLASEEQSAVAQALARLSQREQETLLAHEVSGQDTVRSPPSRGRRQERWPLS
jgi:serine/threonine-protein kinase RsbT